MLGIIMFFVALALLVTGFPVAFIFGGVAILFGTLAEGIGIFSLLPYRIYDIMTNSVLMAIPLFIFMGVILQKTKLAEQLLESMGHLFGRVRGGLAISTVLVGTLLAASTGVVGASVVAMGLISLPVMLKHRYQADFACGTICAAGTLGQIIPPSIILIILGDVFGLPIGDVFQAALLPGAVLVGAYIVYLLGYAWLHPDKVPLSEGEQARLSLPMVLHALIVILPTLSLIIIVLGSIFSGIATPTESSAIGCLGAIVLAILYRKFNLSMLLDAAMETIKVTAMIFAILVGATAFSMAFTYSGGDQIVEELLLQLPGEKWGFLLFSMLVIIVLGFFIDFVEISFIIVPILAPIAETLGINLMWFAILISMNLQTSFLTPPFGFSLFYLKGVAPPSVNTLSIYRGVLPFIAIQVLVLASILAFPSFYGF